jgi:membrane fusion protein, copper/silver efflux system
MKPDKKNRAFAIYRGTSAVVLLLVILNGCFRQDDTSRGNPESAKQKEYYTCTMHPQIVSDRPGVCPICGMELIKKISEGTDQTERSGTAPGTLDLSDARQALSNVAIYKVLKEKLKAEFSSYSYLDIAEQNRKTIAARFNGRIEKFFVGKTGDRVAKGSPLFEIYSPDLVQAQNEYLIALSGAGKNELSSNAENNSSYAPSLLNSARKKLELLGLTQSQISELETKRIVQMTMTYYSPVSGTVIEKKVQEGEYVKEGNSIYEIADLSTIWDISEVYEDEIAGVSEGSMAILHLKAYPAEEFRGKVALIYPVVDHGTKTIKVRSEFNNRGMKLKPQMYGETSFTISRGNGLLVPAGAVLFTGKRNVVWVKTGKSIFEAHEVAIGSRFGDKYQVISGLNEGDEIAATGGFLIDSESNLRNYNGVPRQTRRN